MAGAGGVGGFLMANVSGTNTFACYDGNGNVTALINAADRSIAARYECSPFGELNRVTGPLAKANPFRWSTKFWDEESGLVVYPERTYAPFWGRWLSRDPWEEEGGNNLYALVGNNPLNDFDPFDGLSGKLN